MNITTLTLNPAYDIHVSIGEFRLGHENLADSTVRDIGGKGINISRALSANSVKNRALVVLGKDNGSDFKHSLTSIQNNSHEHFSYINIDVPGRIRENITIHPKGSSKVETRLSFKGFECEPELLGSVCSLIAPTAGDIVTFTGSLPVGISAHDAECFLTELRSKNVHIVIDSKSISLDSMRRIKPWLIKPNAEEITQYLGRNMDTSELIKAAEELHNDGIENVMISLGGDGAVFVSDVGSYVVRVPKIDAVSTIGAGDSSIAGFIAAYSCGKSPLECIRTAVSYGTAACLREGTNPPLPADIERIYRNITITSL